MAVNKKPNAEVRQNEKTHRVHAGADWARAKVLYSINGKEHRDRNVDQSAGPQQHAGDADSITKEADEKRSESLDRRHAFCQ